MERSLTIYLKGIAIILMVMHHSFAFPEWYVDGISFPYLIPYVKYINRFAGFAVVPMLSLIHI